MLLFSLFFFFNDTATTEIYTLSYTTLFRSLVEPHQPLVPAFAALGLDVALVGHALPAARPQAVDAEPARQLREPGADRVVVPQPVEVLVRAREDLLEDVLRRVLLEPEALHADRIHVAGEVLHELAPRLLVAGAAAADELRFFGHATYESAHPAGKKAAASPV